MKPIHTIMFDDILFDVKIKVRRYHNFLVHLLKKHPADLLDLSKKQYKELLDNPTPLFVRELFALYNFHVVSVNDDIYIKFKKYFFRANSLDPDFHTEVKIGQFKHLVDELKEDFPDFTDDDLPF